MLPSSRQSCPLSLWQRGLSPSGNKTKLTYNLPIATPEPCAKVEIAANVADVAGVCQPERIEPGECPEIKEVHRRILAVATGNPQNAKLLIRLAQMEFNSHSRAALTLLVRLHLLGHSADGYFLPPHL